MKKLFLLPLVLLFTAATYGPPFSVSDFSSLTNRPNPSAVNPVAVVLGKTNAYDGNGGIFVFTPSSTNAVDGDIYLTTTTTGRWVRLTRDFATIQSPLVLSNGTLSLAALTNYFTFLAGTNMQVTVTSNTVTYAMTNTVGSGNRITVNGGTVTNFWDNGYITFLDAGGGDYSLNIGNDTISTNKINSTFYNWILSLSGGGGGTTNGLGVNGTFRTDWNAINSAEIAYTVSAGTNWYGSLVAGSVAAAKLATTGTGTSTNFLAGDYSYKQVTTNMIPGLNAILATIGTGGSGGESNTASNLGTPSATNQGWYASKSGVDLQFRSLQVGPNLTLTSNANSIRLDVTLSTNSGTVVSVDGGSSLATVNFADSTGIAASLSTTNASFALVDRDFGDLTVSSSGTVMTIDNNVITSNKVAAANITQDKLGTSGTGLSTNFLAGDYSYKQVTTNMIPGLNAILATISSGGSGGGTNIKVNGTLVSNANLVNSSNALFNVSGSDISITITNVSGTTTDNVVQRTGFALFTIDTSYTMQNLTVGGVITNATVAAGGASTRGLIDFVISPSRSSTNYVVHWEIEGEDPTGLGSPNAAIVANSKTTSAFQLAARFDNNERFPNGVKYIIWLEETVSVGGSGSGSDTNWDGTAVSSGTITNLTSSSITLNGVTITNWPGYYLKYDEQYTGFLNGLVPATSANPFTGNTFGSATTTSIPSEPNHNGIYRLATGGTASAVYGYISGYGTGLNGIAISGGEAFEVVFRVLNTNGCRASFGFHDATSDVNAGTDVVSIRIGRTTGAWNSLDGVCRFNSTETATSTSYTFATNTWYIASGSISTNLGTANFSLRLFSDNSVLWTNSVSTNIPNGGTRLTAIMFSASHTNSGTSILDLDSIYAKARNQ